MSEQRLEIYRAGNAALQKYVYFLLAVAGAAIGFAVTQTKAAALDWRHVPLGLAVLCWGGSFLSGCRHLDWTSAAMHTNDGLLRMLEGREPLTGQNPTLIAAGADKLREIIEDQSSKAQSWLRLQYRLLLSGAALFIVWHVTEMWLRR